MHAYIAPALFLADELTVVMAVLVLFVTTVVIMFSRRYLAGDRNYRRHHYQVLLLAGSLLTMVLADNLLLFWIAWGLSNLLLVKLMIHKHQWNAARRAGILALKSLGLGCLLLAVGFSLLAYASDSVRIDQIVSGRGDPTSPLLVAGLLLVMLAAVNQSAAWPMHRWLLSSLNSPTPVSALMHAGLVNGGGFLLVRFSPLLITQSLLLQGLFAIGLITALVGTFWKLLQVDVKRMLACSTMAQMGFMLMQCGMGLFAPAVSHLCWHGLFKAYLFLNAGSVLRESPRVEKAEYLSGKQMLLAALAGSLGAGAFALTSGFGWDTTNTTCLMTALAFIATAQLGFWQSKDMGGWQWLLIPVVGTSAGAMYGLSVLVVESALGPLRGEPQPLNWFYVTGMVLLVIPWVAMNLGLSTSLQKTTLWKRLYMAGLNSSQPRPDTVTAERKAYQF